MALNSTDLLLVQQGADLRKATLDQIESYISAEIAAGDAISFLGDVDLTAAYNAGAQLSVNPPNNGDIYMNTGTGTIAAGWVIEGGATTCVAGQRVLWDGGDNNWILIGSDGVGAGTLTGIAAQNGIETYDTGDAQVPGVQGIDATTTAKGVVELSDVADLSVDGDYAVPASNALTEFHYNELQGQLETLAGGGITTITGDAPITVSGTGNAREIGVTDASTTDRGVTVLNSTPTYNDTRETVAVTPAGLVANWVPKNWADIPNVTP